MKLTANSVRASPWNLSERQEQVLTAIAVHGNDDLAAQSLGITRKGIEFHMNIIKGKMNERNRLLLMLAFDRWARKGKRT